MYPEEIIAKSIWDRENEKPFSYGSDWKIFKREFPLEAKARIKKAKYIISDLGANGLYVVDTSSIDGG